MISFEDKDSQTSFEQIPKNIKSKPRTQIVLVVWFFLIALLVGFYFFQKNELRKDFSVKNQDNSINSLQNETQQINIPDYSENY